jgi:hypothetical protein
VRDGEQAGQHPQDDQRGGGPVVDVIAGGFQGDCIYYDKLDKTFIR